jgi:hypothetical protein
MTAWRYRIVRHIPDEELNAYLDQALSRSQCIEIETHLALCSACRRNRDGIAALRDRTTSLLALAMPRKVTPPSWSDLQKRAVAQKGFPWRRSALWAASVAGALLTGWGLRTAADPHGSPAAGLALAPELPPIIATRPAAPVTIEETSTPAEDPTPAYGSDAEVRLATTHRPAPPVVAPAPALPSSALTLDQGWQAISIADAEEQTGRLVPVYPDLPVVQVLIRQAAGAGRPLLVVTQQEPGGEKIHTVEGPVEEVADLVAAQLAPAVGLKSSEPSRSPPDYVEAGGSVRRTSRVLAVMGRMTVDSLNALAAGVVLK